MVVPIIRKSYFWNNPETIGNRDCCLLKSYRMRGILFVVAIILLIGWGVGIFVYALKGLFNILLILALIAFILAIFNRGKQH